MTTCTAERAGAYLAVGTLASGLRVAVRPLTPDDAEEIDSGYRHLSPRSRFLRFLTGKPRLTRTDLRMLVGEVDQHDHLALALVWPRSSRADVILGDVHAIRLPSHPDTADVAVTVTDELQGQGAGRLLIHTLAALAPDHGITRFTATVSTENTASRHLLTSVGVVVSQCHDSGVTELTVELTPVRGRGA